MSLRKEVRVFIADTRAWMKRVNVGAEAYKDIIAIQQKQIEELHAKLLARDLPELVNFKLRESLVDANDGVYKAEEDEDMAGEIMEVEGDKGT